MKRLILQRKSGLYARLRAFVILVDSEAVGKLKHGEELEVDVSDTAETLQVKIDWGTSDPIDVRSLNDGQRLDIKGHLTLNRAKSMGLDGLPVTITPV